MPSISGKDEIAYIASEMRTTRSMCYDVVDGFVASVESKKQGPAILCRPSDDPSRYCCGGGTMVIWCTNMSPALVTAPVCMSTA